MMTRIEHLESTYFLDYWIPDGPKNGCWKNYGSWKTLSEAQQHQTDLRQAANEICNLENFDLKAKELRE